LLTVRGRRLLATCDVVVYDYLVDPDILRLAPTNAERIYAGKIGGGRSTSQQEINRLMIRHAREGKRVVRLKGGDPFLFGRGSEEAEALDEAGVRFKIVPGVSSALAVPAYAGIPVTHRGAASSVAIVSAVQARDGSVALDQLAKVSSADTIVILMGAAVLREVAAYLIECGRDMNTPVAVIRWGTYEAQQTVVSTLESIANDVAAAGLRSPAVIIVGDVVRLRERLRWFEKDLLDQVGVERLLAV
jgi:uroporphyrin-III C-methyltransferase